MKVCMVGTGYVGLVSGTCLAEMGNRVTCVDISAENIENIRSGVLPIHEPGLEELVHMNVQEGRLHFTTDLAEGLRDAIICFIAVGTPQDAAGAADVSAVLKVAEDVGALITRYTVVAVKSTVPVGTAHRVAEILGRQAKVPFAVVSNPEFLKQGAAVMDFLRPDRIVVGSEDSKALNIMRELYEPFLRTGNPVITMDTASAEMTKYVANAFLATKISFINEMSRLCEAVGADMESVRHGVTSDPRIGRLFMFPGVGYGGSCLPKDVKALIHVANERGQGLSIMEAVDRVNHEQPQFFLQKIFNHFSDPAGKIIAVWGLSFKPNTDDLRESPSLTVIPALLERGFVVRGFDPKAGEKARNLFAGAQIVGSAYEALDGADALVILTEWNEFRRPDFRRMKELMREQTIFDGRNLFAPDRMASRGFRYYCIGKATDAYPAVWARGRAVENYSPGVPMNQTEREANS
ncbi:MAG: UDP-glucose/GDP-mannose dehydrogenase family protein [Vulcanimicrobiota bacterium]